MAALVVLLLILLLIDVLVPMFGVDSRGFTGSDDDASRDKLWSHAR